jgi:zinc protease
MVPWRQAALLLLAGIASRTAAAAPAVSEFMLDNGLKVLIQEDHRAPVVITQVWYKVGSSYEHEGVTGISHLLEHMMFKGTVRHPAGDFSRIIAANGGDQNAFTGQDYTAYYQTLERSRLAVSFELEADRMRNLRLLPEDFLKEQQVVIEERRLRTDDQPRARQGEQFAAMAYTNSPYRNPVVGWPEDLAHLTVDDLRNWYQRWYAPNNAILVVAGDVDPAAVLKLAQEHFGPLPASPMPPPKPRAEVEQLGRRQMTVRLPARLSALIMGYKVPTLVGAADPAEAYALAVAAGILDGGNSARLASRLVRGQQVAAGVGAGYNLHSRLPSLFRLDGTPAQGQTLLALEAALLAEVRKLQEELVAPEELDRVKAQVLAGKVYELDSLFYQAMRLGMAEAIGLGWRRIDEYMDRINAVTPEQIQQVARKYLVEDRLSVSYFEPLPMSADAAAPAPPGGQNAR